MYSIYILIDPTDNQVKYVGRVKNGRESDRVSEHVYSSHRNPWVDVIKLKGIRPILQVIDTDGSLSNEEFYTEYFRYIGCNLSNKYVGRRKSREAANKQSKSLSESYRSGRIKPPYEKGCKKDPSIGRKISESKKKHRG